ncbi:MAG: prealbumin-like fold domain-containing protein [Clostridiales bacterium]|nr:prealbumin-like fold domain-containing protein [Clostridiales bacterium]
MKRFINLVAASILLITTVFAPAAYAAAPDGGNTLNLHTGDAITIKKVSRDQYFMTLAGRPIETNVYQISGGNGIDQFMYCLEHGSGYAPGNAIMNIKDVYSWQGGGKPENGMLYNETTHQPVPTENLQVTLKSGYTLTPADTFALDTIYQNSYSLKNRISIDWVEVSYATQNAFRAFITDIAGVTWGAESVSYAGGAYYDGSGRLCVGSVKARNVSDNNILQYSYELYKLAMKARAEAKIVSDAKLKLVKISEDNLGDMTTIKVRVDSGGSAWQVSQVCKEELVGFGGSIDKASGSDGETITLTVPNEQLENFVLDVRSREARSSGNLYFAIPQNAAYQKMIGMNSVINDNKQDTMTFKLLGEVDDDIPLPEVPKFTFPGKKSDQEGGFDDNVQSGRGDALLNAGFELYIDGVYKTTFYADEFGLNGISDPIEIWRAEDLTPSIGTHKGSGMPNSVSYDVSATVRIKEIVPEGYLSEPESGQGRTGYREFSVRFRAKTSRTIRSDGDGGWDVEPWEDYQYYITPDTGYNNSTDDRKQSETRFINLVQKGNLHINKTIEKDFDPWGDVPATKVPMEGAKFTIRLTGAGSERHPYLRAVKITKGQEGYDPWANCYRIVKDGSGTAMDGKGGESSFFTTSEFGQIRIYDIPWGTYQIDEIAASTEGYVLEHTNITISKNEQLLSKDIVDYVIRDELVIYKVDSETEKRIPSAKMAFRLRYMGNPNTPLEERQKDKNYGKYLSANSGSSGAQTYTFFTDANGKCAFPYPLQYGEYQIEELVAPDGYYIEEYDGTGDYPYLVHKFTINKMGENPFEHPVVELSIKNNPVKGRIEVIKTGETITGFTKKNTEYGVINLPTFESKPKDGIRFDIFAKSDVKLPDGIDAPLFVDRGGKPVELDTVVENHALWKNALRTEEKVMPDGTALSITTERYPDDLAAMSKANLLTATSKPNKYVLEYSVENDEFIENYKYDIYVEYTPDGYAVSEINVTKKTEHVSGTLAGTYLFPENTYAEIATGSEKTNGVSGYRNQVFANKNEISMDYLYNLDLVKTSERLLIEPPCDFAVKYEGHGTAYHTYTNGAKTEFYTAMWTDESHSAQVFVKHSNTDENYAKYFLAGDVKSIAPIECLYVMQDGELAEMVTTPAGLYLTDKSDEKFIFADDEEEPTEYFVAVESDGSIEYAACGIDWRAWENLPSEEEWPQLADYALMYGRMLEKQQIMFEKDGEYLIFAEIDGKPGFAACSSHGEVFDTKIEAFTATLFKSPYADGEIVLAHDNGFVLTVDTDVTGGKVRITRPEFSSRPVTELDENTKIKTDENSVELSIPVTEPSVFMELNDGTRVGLVYSGGYAFTTVEVPLGNEYPVLIYEGATRSLTKNEQGDVLSPLTPKLDLLTPDASGDRISAELITPPLAPVESTVFRAATKRMDTGAIVFIFPDGRKMEISAITDQDGKTRGHASITCFTPTYRYLLGEFVESITTGEAENGKAVSSLLPLGQYVVRESNSVKGVFVEDGDYEVTLDYQGNYVPLVWGSTSVDNKMASMQLNVKKVFQTGQGSEEYMPKAGAVFGVYTGEKILNLEKGSLIGVLVTDKNGMATDAFKAPFGEYYLKEIKTLSGYDLNPYMYPFTYDENIVDSPLKTQFNDEGVTVEYRYVDDNNSQLVVKTLKQIPQISYKVNGVEIDAAKAGVKAAGNLLISTELTGIDHMAKISNIGKQTVQIEFENGGTIEYKAGDKSFEVVVAQPEDNALVEVTVPEANSTDVKTSKDSEGNNITAISFKLGLNNITYRASLDASLGTDPARPMMKSGKTLIYRETNIAAGTDKLVLENIDENEFVTDIPFRQELSTESRYTVDINELHGVADIEILSKCIIKVERNGETISLSADSEDAAAVNKDGAIAETAAGVQPDGSVVKNNPLTIVYYTKDLTINDINNSKEFVRAKLGAVYAEGELTFGKVPLSAYKDGAPVEPGTNMVLDKMACYTFLLSDGVTKADVVLMPDNTLKATLDGKVTSNFEAYNIPVLQSQGETALVVDKHGEPFAQAAAYRMKTIDGMTYFVNESRTYTRADAFAPVTRIELNTADGVMQGILNDLTAKPTKGPEEPGEPKKPEEPSENEGEFVKKDEEAVTIEEKDVPVTDTEEQSQPDLASEDAPRIPKTGKESSIPWGPAMLMALAAALAFIETRKHAKQ